MQRPVCKPITPPSGATAARGSRYCGGKRGTWQTLQDGGIEPDRTQVSPHEHNHAASQNPLPPFTHLQRVARCIRRHKGCSAPGPQPAQEPVCACTQSVAACGGALLAHDPLLSHTTPADGAHAGCARGTPTAAPTQGDALDRVLGRYQQPYKACMRKGPSCSSGGVPPAQGATSSVSARTSAEGLQTLMLL